MIWRWRGDGGGSNGRRWLLPVAASSSSCCLLLSLPLSCVYSVLHCFRSGGGGRWSGKRLGGEMTMIPGGGAAIFSSPPLCRARGLCFFFPLCSVLFLFSLSGSAGVGSADGGGMVGLLVVAGRNDGGAGGGATVALLFPLLSCSFPLLCISKKQSHVWFPFPFSFCSPLPLFPPLFFPVSAACFPLLSKKFLLPLLAFPSLFVYPSLFLQNFAPPGFPFFRFYSLHVFPCSFLFFCFARAPLLSNKLSPLFSVLLSPQKSSPLCPVIFPYIYRMSRERVTIPVQVQGMVAWDGSCAAAAGHDLLFVMVGGMGLLFLH